MKMSGIKRVLSFMATTELTFYEGDIMALYHKNFKQVDHIVPPDSAYYNMGSVIKVLREAEEVSPLVPT